MNVIKQYLDKSRAILDCIESQEPELKTAARWFADTILKGRMVHVFGSGHSRIMVEEMWPRYGSFAGFNPIVELSLTFHNLVVGANGQRQAMFLENVSGLADKIMRNFDTSNLDSALIISSSGTNIVPIEMAEIMQSRGIKVVALITKLHSDTSTSKRQDGKKLSDFADLILDTGAPVGDAMIQIEGMEMPVSPGSTIGGATIVNCIKAEVAQYLTDAGHPPMALAAGAIVGAARATEIFEAAYDEHAHRIAKMYQKLGIPSYVSSEL
jgi:uncharacterized phosphosugar-binding protein